MAAHALVPSFGPARHVPDRRADAAAAMTPRTAAAWGGLLVGVVLLHAVVLDRLARPGEPAVQGRRSAVQAVWLRMPIATARAETPAPQAAAATPAPAPAAPAPPAAVAKPRAPRKPAAAQPAVTPPLPPAPVREAHAGDSAEADGATRPVAAAALQVAIADGAPPPEPGPASASAAPPAAAERAGDDGPDLTPVPVYRTRIPAAWTATYKLSRSGITGSGEIDWQHDGNAYTLRLEGKVPLFGSLLAQTSRGGFDAAGLAPERFTDKRLRRSEQAANFQRAAGKVSFSGQQPDVPLTPGVQDRLSVMLQLAAVANAWAKPPAAGTEIAIRVIGARGDVSVWALRFEGVQVVDTPSGGVKALRFLREPQSAHGTRAEFWLDPARQHQPVRARFTDGSGDPLELQRVDATP